MSVKKPLQVLHIDDSSILRKTVHRGLEAFKEHYELTQAESVDQALGLLSSGKKFDVILTDWLMNGKSGLDLLCTLKSHPTYHRLPVFFLTSEYDSNSLIMAVTHGASGILKKPASGPEIHAYFEKKASLIEESFLVKEDFFSTEAKPPLAELQHAFPLKNTLDLTACLQLVQKFKATATTSKWPLLADYSQKIEDTIQLTIKHEAHLLNPITKILKDYHSFMEHAVMQVEEGRPHRLPPATLDKNLKSYQENLEAGWFTNKSAEEKIDGVVLPWDVAVELQQYLTPEGLVLLEKYLGAYKKAV